jgi:hypothetical protein
MSRSLDIVRGRPYEAITRLRALCFGEAGSAFALRRGKPVFAIASAVQAFKEAFP